VLPPYSKKAVQGLNFSHYIVSHFITASGENYKTGTIQLHTCLHKSKGGKVMHIKKRLFSLAMLLLLFSLHACGGGGATDPVPPPGTGTVRLHNNSGVTIDYAYLTLSTSSTWGPNQLPGPLASGYYYDIFDVAAGTYDAQAVVAGVYSTYYGYFYSFGISAGSTSDLYAVSSGFTGSLKIVNGTVGAYILGLYVTPSESQSWGVNQIFSGIGPSGSKHLTDLPAGPYDIMVVWDTGPDSFYWSNPISSLTLLTQTVL
jgi:hypothetical protein